MPRNKKRRGKKLDSAPGAPLAAAAPAPAHPLLAVQQAAGNGATNALIEAEAPKESQAERQQRRQALVDKKLAAHADRVKQQSSEYDANPALSGTLYATPSTFSIDGSLKGDGAKKTTADYATAAKAQGAKPEHYMSDLMFTEKQFKDRRSFEEAEEASGGHSGGFFESKYTPQQRENFSSYGGADVTGKGTDQVFHPGRHNPWQSDFNLEHRLTHGVAADSALGATTDISTKFISDAIAMEAMNLAKTKAAADLAARPAAYRDGGKFWKSFSVVVDLGKPTGAGFEATADGTDEQVVDMFGHQSVHDNARKKALSLGLNQAKATAVAQAAVAAIPTIATTIAALGPTASGNQKKNAPVNALKSAIKSAVPTLSDAHAQEIAKEAARGVAKTFDKADIAPVNSGITGAQVGITLQRINPDGTGAVFEPGATQHFPAKTAPFSMKRFGHDTYPP